MHAAISTPPVLPPPWTDAGRSGQPVPAGNRRRRRSSTPRRHMRLEHVCLADRQYESYAVYLMGPLGSGHLGRAILGLFAAGLFLA